MQRRTKTAVGQPTNINGRAAEKELADTPPESARLRSEIVELREQLRIKEAALQNRRAVLAQTETRLNGELQELTVELAHERQRRHKRERELHSALAEVSAMHEQKTPAASSHDAAKSNTSRNDRSARAQCAHKRRWRFSLSAKRRWKSS